MRPDDALRYLRLSVSITDTDKQHALDVIAKALTREPVSWQYRTMYDLGHARENDWCDWRDCSQNYFNKVNSDIAMGQIRIQTRTLHADLGNVSVPDRLRSPPSGSHRDKSLTPHITNETHGIPARLRLLARVWKLISHVKMWSEWPDEADIGPTLLAVEKFLDDGGYDGD